jgi:CDP-glucose 4,6-dehydratase
MESVFGDVRDLEHLESTCRARRPDVVFHLAAQSIVRTSYERPLETFDVNVIGTAGILEAVRRVGGVRSVVIITSDKCYEATQPSRRHEEDDRIGGDDPYSASKACAELVTAAYRKSFADGAAGVATARAGNVIGGGDWADDRLLPDLMRAFDEKRQAMIRRPDAVRPWQHVLDPLHGYLALGEALYADPGRFAGAWNFGPAADNERPVAELADAAARVWGHGATWVEDRGSHPHESHALRLDSAKAADGLSWHARISLKDAVEWTVRWHKAFASGAPANELVSADIARYEGLVA